MSETGSAVEAIEGKLANMVTRMTCAEAHLDMLEEVEWQRCVTRPRLQIERESGKASKSTNLKLKIRMLCHF